MSGLALPGGYQIGERVGANGMGTIAGPPNERMQATRIGQGDHVGYKAVTIDVNGNAQADPGDQVTLVRYPTRLPADTSAALHLPPIDTRSQHRTTFAALGAVLAIPASAGVGYAASRLAAQAGLRSPSRVGIAVGVLGYVGAQAIALVVSNRAAAPARQSEAAHERAIADLIPDLLPSR